MRYYIANKIPLRNKTPLRTKLNCGPNLLRLTALLTKVHCVQNSVTYQTSSRTNLSCVQNSIEYQTHGIRDFISSQASLRTKHYRVPKSIAYRRPLRTNSIAYLNLLHIKRSTHYTLSRTKLHSVPEPFIHSVPYILSGSYTLRFTHSALHAPNSPHILAQHFKRLSLPSASYSVDSLARAPS